MGILECLFRVDHLSPTLHAIDENIGKDLEDKGGFCLCVPGRHFGVGPLREAHEKRFGLVLDTLLEAGFKINTKKYTLFPCKQVQHLGMVLDFEKGVVEVPPHKLKAIQKELGKLVTHQRLTCRKSGQYFGAGSKLSGGFAFLEAGDRSIASVQQFTPHQRLGPWSSHFSRISFAGVGARNFSTPRFWPKVSDNPFQEFAFRQLSGGLGGGWTPIQGPWSTISGETKGPYT